MSVSMVTARRLRYQVVMRFIAAWFGAAVALTACLFLLGLTEHSWLLASLGGSCVIVFGMADTDMAQPRSLLGGHLVAAVTGLVFLELWRRTGWPKDLWMVASVATALVVMMATRTIHSPAGANPIVIFAEDADWLFLLSPVAAGVLSVFIVALLANNYARPAPRGRYPRAWR
jgi:CBS-domain-containing membrane protein